MTQLRALVVDDEPNARALLRRLLETEPDLHVVGDAASGAEAIVRTRELEPDVLFLDIEMPDLDGFAVLEQLGERSQLPSVVFVTAYDEFALKAFEVHAIDYLLKPFDEERLRETVARVRERLGASRQVDLSERLGELVATLERRPLERLAVKHRDESVVLRAGEIDWLEAEENYVRVHTGTRSYLARSTLQSLEDRLDANRFVRLHRSTLANVDRIRRLTPWSHGDLRAVLADGTTLKVSRRYRDRLEKVLEILS